MKNIPNILSFGRILLIPIFIWQFLKGNTINAVLILAVSGLTDLLDGYLARRNNWITQLGKVLDPAADKLTLISVCITLMIALKEYRIFFIVMLAKDFVMLLLGALLIRKDVKLEGAKWLGKIATAVFYLSMILIGLLPNLPHELVLGILSVVTLVEIIAAISYIPDFLRYVKESKLKQ